MPCLGVPLLDSDTDDATLGAFLSGRYPAVLDFELEAVAAGLNDGVLIDLDSFVGDLADQGFVVSGSGEPLNRAALDAGLTRIAAASDATNLVPRLLLALGKERVDRARVYRADPTWGDASLDSLQFLLLTLGFPAVERVNPDAADRAPRVALAGLVPTGRRTRASVRDVTDGPSVAQGVEGGAAVDWIALIADKGLNVVFPNMLDSQFFALCSQV
ncbi:MAG: hypothetical protein ABIP53_03765, partial [Candidatus Limnocylindrales bacterium]